MERSIAPARVLAAVAAAGAAVILFAGCGTCNSAATVKANPACPAPVVATCAAPGQVQYVAAPAAHAYIPGPVCDGSVAFDGSVIQNGVIVHDNAVANRAAAGLPPYPNYAVAVLQDDPAVEFKAVPIGRPIVPGKTIAAAPVRADDAVRAKKPARREKRKAREAVKTAPEAVVVAPGTALVPTAVGAQDVTALANATEPYTITEGKTYTINVPEAAAPAAVAPVPAPAFTVVPNNIGEVYTDPVEAARAVAPAAKVLGPSTMGFTADELDNYSRTDVFEIPAQPAPVQ